MSARKARWCLCPAGPASISEQVLGGHAVLALGYGDSTERFIVRNSRGDNWGMAGYFTMPYAFVTDSALAPVSRPTRAREDKHPTRGGCEISVRPRERAHSGRHCPVPVVEEEFKRIGAIGVAKVGIRTLARRDDSRARHRFKDIRIKTSGKEDARKAPGVVFPMRAAALMTTGEGDMRQQKRSSRCLEQNRRWRQDLPLALALSAVASLASGSAAALVLNASYDTSVNSAPGGFKTAFQSVIDFFQNTFSDPITINIGVGWGEVGGYSISAGALGQSQTYLAGYYNYGQVRNALIADAKSSTDSTAVSSLRSTDPTGGGRELMATAEAKALGLRSSGGTDGFVGFASAAQWTFDPNNRAVLGAYDFIGVAEHEVSEILGRTADLGSFYSALEPLDLFRYSGLNTRALTPGDGQYFSIDGGVTNLNIFNGTGVGDLGDWAGYTIDAFNAAAGSGVLLPISEADIVAMDVIGYDVRSGLATSGTFPAGGFVASAPSSQLEPVPEPGSLALLAAALLGLGLAIQKPTRERACRLAAQRVGAEELLMTPGKRG